MKFSYILMILCCLFVLKIVLDKIRESKSRKRKRELQKHISENKRCDTVPTQEAVDKEKLDKAFLLAKEYYEKGADEDGDAVLRQVYEETMHETN